MAEPRHKRLRGILPTCPGHQPHRGSRVRQNLPPELEESLCGVTTGLLRLSYRFLALAEVFDQSTVALPNVSKFFLEQARQEEKMAEVMLKHLSVRGGKYCSKTIEKPSCEHVRDVVTALTMALDQWKTMMRCFEELYNISIDCADPHTAGLIKKRFVEPKMRKVKLTGDLLTNASRLNCPSDGRSSFGEYLIDQLQKELKP
ncbi:ferritin, higher subunit-like [Pelodytes ibericus]